MTIDSKDDSWFFDLQCDEPPSDQINLMGKLVSSPFMHVVFGKAFCVYVCVYVWVVDSQIIMFVYILFFLAGHWQLRKMLIEVS